MTKVHARYRPERYSVDLTLQASIAATGSSRAYEHAHSRIAADDDRIDETVHTRDTLLTTVAHDLKNALGTVRLRADLLLEQLESDNLAPGGEKSLSFRSELARILVTSTHMERLLDELLGLARMQAGHRLDLIREPVDVCVLVERVVSEFLETRGQPHIRIVATEAEMVGSWDPWQLERVFRNLLSNAVKFSPDGGEISVRLDRHQTTSGDFAACAVADNGLGIPEGDLVSVFERFYRGRNVRGRIGGSGIGLAVAGQIVHEHGGTLKVESREGTGSTFTVRLPLSGGGPAQGTRRQPADGDTAAALGLLFQANLLSSIPAAAPGGLAEQSAVRTFGTGAHPMQQGQLSESLFLILRGRVRAHRSRGPGRTPSCLPMSGRARWLARWALWMGSGALRPSLLWKTLWRSKSARVLWPTSCCSTMT